MKQISRFLAAFLAVLLITSVVLPDLVGVLSVKAETKTKTVSLVITEGLKAGETYMDGMVSVGTDMTYTAGEVALKYADGKDAGSADGYVTNKTNPNASAGTGALIRFQPTHDGTIQVAAQLGKGKTFRIDTPIDTSDGQELQEIFSYSYSGEDKPKNLNLKFEEVKVKADTTYYIYGAGTKARFYSLTYEYDVEEAGGEKPDTPPIELVKGVLAFPTAEGGGMYATGGRGGDVYVVTNLEDSGEGSLRYGIETAPAEGRIIVFNVGGTINLKSTLSFKGKKNITIAGQTAPGDGITVAGYDTSISDSENIVIRFVRFRVGTENLLNGGDSMDALWGRDNDTFIIDHCTFSWNTDETLSTYRGKNGTVQWCLISESLTVSGHSKGRHGYGGIWGGDNTVFQYNLIANHTSRNPRIGGGSMGDPVTDGSTATLQLSNNVLYNHGYFACYGGGFTYTNFINNYTKPGQGTRDSLTNTLLSFGENGKVGGVYYAGNVLEGNADVTKDNSRGFRVDSSDGQTSVSDTLYKAEAFNQITLRSAEDCYELVLNSAGATYPHRDAVDARVVAQVKTDTGTYINTPNEVGGYPAEYAEADKPDTDKDGIPDDWEKEHGLDPKDGTDSRTLCLTNKDDKETYGYAWIEVYFNELVGEVSKAEYVAKNPTVTIDLPDNTLVDEGDSLTVTATASSGAGIEKVVFFNGSTPVATVESAPYTYTYTDSIAKDGTYYISVRAYDKKGNKTQSNTSRVYVNSTAGTGKWSSSDIGNPKIKGTASLVDGVLTIKGAGKLGASEGSNKDVRPELADATTDDFHYVYQKLEGDIEIITRFDSYLPVDNHTFQGLMFRSSLDKGAATAALGFTMVKVDETTIWSAFMVNRAADGGEIQSISETIDSPEAAEKAGIPLIANLSFKEGNDYLGTWLKLSREGDTFTGYVSSDGLVWQKVGSLTVDLPDTVYVGFAVDANRAGNDLINYGTAKFSNIEINQEFAAVTYNTENVEAAGAEKLAVGKDLAVTLTKVTGYVLPENVEVTIDGKPAVIGKDYTYDANTGVILVPNVQSNVTINAYGVKRVVVPVKYDVIDKENLLTVKEEAGKLILTQTATEGNMQTTDKDGVQTDAVNVSYLLFPEVDEYHELSMDIVVKSLTEIGKGDANGFFMGAFAADGTGVYSVLGFRANKVLKGYWYKKDGYTGDGNPGSTVELDKSYHVDFKTDGKGGYNAIVTGENGTSFTKQFKASESFIKTGDTIRYGMAIVGATVEISNMKLVDPENNVIYNQNSADYSAVVKAINKASQLNAGDYENFDAVLEAWNAVELGLDASEQKKVDAMAKALEDAIAALVEKQPDIPGTTEPEQPDIPGTTEPEQPDIPGTTEPEQPDVPEATEPEQPDVPEATEPEKKDETKPDIKAELPESVLTDVVKTKTGCTTVAELTKYMQESVLKGDFANAKTVVMDVTILISLDGGRTWISATEETFPAEGVDVILPYPEGTGKTGYDFTVSHLITMACNGQVPGNLENITPEKTDDGLKIHILSASPFAVAYMETKTSEAERADSKSVYTGDAMSGSMITWSIVLFAAFMVVLEFSGKRKRYGAKNK